MGLVAAVLGKKVVTHQQLLAEQTQAVVAVVVDITALLMLHFLALEVLGLSFFATLALNVEPAAQ